MPGTYVGAGRVRLSRIQAGIAPRLQRKALESVVVVLQRQANLLELVRARVAAGRLRAAWIAGSSRATNTPMMAITTSNSTRVNPRDLDLVTISHLPGVKETNEENDATPLHGGEVQLQSPTIDAM